MQGIKDWGRRNPDKLGPLLDENPSYVFFREVPAPVPGTLEAEIDGPIGTLGVPLLRERTIAVDPRSIPLGAPVFLATTWPLSTRPLCAADAGAGHRRRDSRRGARRLLLGLRRRRRTAGREDETGRADVAAVAQGRGPPAPLAPPVLSRRRVGALHSAGQHLLGLPVGVIRRAHQRADGRVPESHRVRLALERRRTRPGARTAAPADGPAVGCRYWPIVSMSMSCARMSRIAARISSSVSPRPTISPDLVGSSGKRRLNSRRSASECA